ncbi:hypothetical protein [Rhodococcus sp. NPDC057529]|uniref:hypothetical protein n=1 Tax=Rhodococcus sp. NPDC057529 TaxID=3346158 RepID=UPI00366A9DAB
MPAYHSRSAPEGRLAGYLLTLVGERDFATLSAELIPLIRPPGPDPVRGALYGGVLGWLVAALAEVVVARLGDADHGESFVLEVHTTAGRTLGAEDLPAREGRFGRAVLALLAGDRAAARTELCDAETEPDPTVRATTLVEALIWLDALLGADTTDFPDTP